MNGLGTLAYDIYYYDIDSDPDYCTTFISGWLGANIGQLNGYTQEEFAIEDGDISPELEPVEKAIFASLFEIDYYEKKSRNTLKLGRYASDYVTGDSNWTKIQEGDSVFERTSKGTAAREYRFVAQEYKSLGEAAQQKLDHLVTRYDFYKSSPLQVAGLDGVRWPVYEDTE